MAANSKDSNTEEFSYQSILQHYQLAEMSEILRTDAVDRIVTIAGSETPAPWEVQGGIPSELTQYGYEDVLKSVHLGDDLCAPTIENVNRYYNVFNLMLSITKSGNFKRSELITKSDWESLEWGCWHGIYSLILASIKEVEENFS
jgi:hypothetical protein